MVRRRREIAGIGDAQAAEERVAAVFGSQRRRKDEHVLPAEPVAPVGCLPHFIRSCRFTMIVSIADAAISIVR